MKKLLLATAVILMFAFVAYGQWEYQSDLAIGTQPHGVQVDPDGKIWVGYYGPADTLVKGDGTEIAINSLRCYNPDGTQTDFSPVMVFTDGGEINDTLDFALPLSSRGIQVDHNGNILYVGSRGQMYRINYQDGMAMNRLYTPVEASLTQPAVDENGFIYLGHVGGGNPCYIFDEDFELYNYVADTIVGLQRSIVCSPSGQDLYFGKIYSGLNGVMHFYSEDGPDGEYMHADSLWVNPDRVMWGQCINYAPNGLIWVGTYWDVGPTDFSGWYALDPTQDYAVVDTIGQNAKGVLEMDAPDGSVPPGGLYWSPRGIAFSPDGMTAYTADFDGSVVKVWTNDNPAQPGDPPIITQTKVAEYFKEMLPTEFRLAQNYPNPFNPTTRIPFAIDVRGQVELKVYDVTGRQVKTLVNQEMNPGNHEVTFDGSGLASGVYYYSLKFNGKIVTKQMMLLK